MIKLWGLVDQTYRQRGADGGWGGLEERGYEGGDLRRIKNEISIMEHVEHNTTIERNVKNEDDIEDFKVLSC